MKKIILLLLLSVSILKPQLLLRNPETDYQSLSFSNELFNKLKSSLTSVYKIYSFNKEIKNLSDVQEDFTYALNKKFNKQFDYNVYELNLKIIESKLSNRSFDVSMIISGKNDGLVFTLKDSLLSKEKVEDVLATLKAIILSKVPVYLPCRTMKDGKVVFETTSRSLEENELNYELLDSKGVVIASVDPDFISAGLLTASVKLKAEQLGSELSAEDIYLRSFRKSKYLLASAAELAEFRDEDIAKASETRKEADVNTDKVKLKKIIDQNETETYQTGMDLRNNDWITVCATNTVAGNIFMNDYFSSGVLSGFSPLYAQVQLNIMKTETRPYLYGRIAFPIERELKSGSETKINKFSSFVSGVGIEKRFFVWNRINPSLGFQIGYYSLSNTAKSKNNSGSTEKSFTVSGITAEANASVSFRIGSIAPYAAISAGYGRLKNSENNDIYWTSLVSSSLGVSIFF